MGHKENKKIGQYGIEEYYNEKLEGKIGFLELEKDASGKWIFFGLKNTQDSKDGDDIILTIDQTIQYISEKKLKEAVEKLYGVKVEKVNMLNDSRARRRAFVRVM